MATGLTRYLTPAVLTTGGALLTAALASSRVTQTEAALEPGG